MIVRSDIRFAKHLESPHSIYILNYIKFSYQLWVQYILLQLLPMEQILSHLFTVNIELLNQCRIHSFKLCDFLSSWRFIDLIVDIFVTTSSNSVFVLAEVFKRINSFLENSFSLSIYNRTNVWRNSYRNYESFSPYTHLAHDVFIKYASLKDYHNNCYNDHKMSCFVLLIKRLRSENWSYFMYYVSHKL